MEETLASELFFRLCATSFTVLYSYSFIGRYTFRPNWPSSGVQDAAVKDSAPARSFKAATSNKPNKTKSNHAQPKDTQIKLVVTT
jgi:hypothetical protein